MTNNINNFGTINFFESNHQKPTEQKRVNNSEPEDVEQIDTSFFCTQLFSADIIEKNIRKCIELASSKADACRRVMSLETQGYIVISNVSDDKKAELINPFAAPKYTLCGNDFAQARTREKSN